MPTRFQQYQNSGYNPPGQEISAQMPMQQSTAAWAAPAQGQPAQPGGAPSYQGMGNFGTDPFGYTGGSLLKPWTQQFQAPAGSGGGYSAPEHQKFEFGQFGFNAPNVGQMAAPEKFSYGDFKQPTAADMQVDPGYEFRLKQGMQAMQNSAAARGNLMTGGFQKGLNDYAQGAASQEYGNVYNRALQGYQTNRGNAAENYDRNFSAGLNTFNANTQAALGQGQLGLQAATAGYDRNYGLARTQWQDAADQANAAASAGAANSNQAYNRALQEYQMNYGIFQDNQNNQYNRLMGLSGLGLQGAAQQNQYGSQYANNAGNYLTQGANANAAGQVGSANAWNQGIAGAYNGAAGAYGMYLANQNPNYGGG